jgi:hypothetical protein
MSAQTYHGGIGSIEVAKQTLLRAKRDELKIMHNTTLRCEGDSYIIRYHETDIITYEPDGSILIDCDGWLTSTTKHRLNEFTPFSFSGACWSGYSRAPLVNRHSPWQTYYGGHEPENAGENWVLHADEPFHYRDGMRMKLVGDRWTVRYGFSEVAS